MAKGHIRDPKCLFSPQFSTSVLSSEAMVIGSSGVLFTDSRNSPCSCQKTTLVIRKENIYMARWLRKGRVSCGSLAVEAQKTLLMGLVCCFQTLLLRRNASVLSMKKDLTLSHPHLFIVTASCNRQLTPSAFMLFLSLIWLRFQLWNLCGFVPYQTSHSTLKCKSTKLRLWTLLLLPNTSELRNWSGGHELSNQKRLFTSCLPLYGHITSWFPASRTLQIFGVTFVKGGTRV